VGIILKILGALFLLLIVASFGGYWFLRWRVRKFLGELSNLPTSMGPPPVALKLNRVLGDVEWKQKKAVGDISDRLRAQGFTPVGVFQADAMGDLQIEGWVEASQSLMAAVYQHSAVDQPWLDYVRQYEGSQGDTASSAPMGAETDTKPGNVKLIDAKLGPDDLLDRILAMKRDLIIRPAPATAEEFKERLETAYAEVMEWRIARGGTTKEEILRRAAETGEEISPEVLELTHQRLRGQANAQLAEFLLRRFRKETSLSADEWEKARDSLFFVHDNLSAEELNGFVESASWSEDEDDEDDAAEAARPFDSSNSTPARVAFASFCSTLPSGRRFRRIGEIKDPVPADAYIWDDLPDD
jgi:hypothetical protein